MRKTIDGKLPVKSDLGFTGSRLCAVLLGLSLLATGFSSGVSRLQAQGSAKPRVAQEQRASRPAPQTGASQLEAERRVMAQALALVTEFDVNGLKVLVKRREGSQTVAAGLFIKGGSRN